LVSHLRGDRGEDLGEEHELDGGVFGRELPRERDERLRREHDVQDDRERGLGPALEARDQRVERLDLALNAGGGRRDRLPVVREARRPPAAVEEAQAELGLEAVDGLAHRGGDAPERAGRGGEAPGLGHGAEGAELLDRDALDHGPPPPLAPPLRVALADSMSVRGIVSLLAEGGHAGRCGARRVSVKATRPATSLCSSRSKATSSAELWHPVRAGAVNRRWRRTRLRRWRTSCLR